MRSRFIGFLCGLGAALIFSFPAFAQKVYVSSGTGLFGTLDFALNKPGVVTPFTQVGTLSSVLLGMGYGTDGNIYGIDSSGDYYQLDPHTAKLTKMGSAISTAGGVVSAVSDNNGTMYVLDGNGNLYKVDMTKPATHPSTELGPISFFTAGSSTANTNITPDGYIGLDSGNKLYVGGSPDPTDPNANHDILYKVTVSSNSVNANQVGAAGTDTSLDVLSGGVTANNKLYGFGGTLLSSFNIVSLDTVTGAGTDQAAYKLAAHGGGPVDAALVVRISSVPEASSFVLLSLMLGVGGGGLMLRRKCAASV